MVVLLKRKYHKKRPLRIVFKNGDNNPEIFDCKDMKEADFEALELFMNSIKKHWENSIKDKIAFKELELKILKRKLEE